MLRWLSALDGDRSSLSDLLLWFPDGDAFVIAEGSDHFLVGPKFESMDEPDQVRNLAEAIVEEFTAMSLLFDARFIRPTIGTVYREDEAGNRVGHATSLRSEVTIRMKMRATMTGAPGPTQAQILLRGSRTHTALRTAALLWADPVRTWPRLYRIVEELESYLGKTVSRAGLCSDNERERFRRSANSAEVAGNDSRHGAGTVPAPQKPMTVGDATKLVADLLYKTLSFAAAKGAA